jgi:hypothetical protein
MEGEERGTSVGPLQCALVRMLLRCKTRLGRGYLLDRESSVRNIFTFTRHRTHRESCHERRKKLTVGWPVGTEPRVRHEGCGVVSGVAPPRLTSALAYDMSNTR